MKATDANTKSLIINFLRGAIANKAEGAVYAKLAVSELGCVGRKVRQIRNDSCLARYWDELGNEIRLCNDGFVRQM